MERVCQWIAGHVAFNARAFLLGVRKLIFTEYAGKMERTGIV